MTLKFTTLYYIYYILQSWSKTEKWSHSWIIVLGDYLTNFILIQIVWSDGITLLKCFYPLITFDCGRGSDMLSLCEVQTQQALFSCSHFYEIQKKKMNLFPDTILQVHSFTWMLWTYSVLATRLNNSIKHVCIMLKLQS